MSCIASPVADNISQSDALTRCLRSLCHGIVRYLWGQWGRIYVIIIEQQTQDDCTRRIKWKSDLQTCRIEALLPLKLLTGQTYDHGLLSEIEVSRSPGVSRNSTNSQWQPCPLPEKSKLWFHVELSGNGNVTPWQTAFCPIQSSAGGLPRRFTVPKESN